MKSEREKRANLSHRRNANFTGTLKSYRCTLFEYSLQCNVRWKRRATVYLHQIANLHLSPSLVVLSRSLPKGRGKHVCPRQGFSTTRGFYRDVFEYISPSWAHQTHRRTFFIHPLPKCSTVETLYYSNTSTLNIPPLTEIFFLLVFICSVTTVWKPLTITVILLRPNIYLSTFCA